MQLSMFRPFSNGSKLQMRKLYRNCSFYIRKKPKGSTQMNTKRYVSVTSAKFVFLGTIVLAVTDYWKASYIGLNVQNIY